MRVRLANNRVGQNPHLPLEFSMLDGGLMSSGKTMREVCRCIILALAALCCWWCCNCLELALPEQPLTLPDAVSAGGGQISTVGVGWNSMTVADFLIMRVRLANRVGQNSHLPLECSMLDGLMSSGKTMREVCQCIILALAALCWWWCWRRLELALPGQPLTLPDAASAGGGQMSTLGVGWNSMTVADFLIRCSDKSACVDCCCSPCIFMISME